MPNLSIKNVPELVVEKLRARAAANHRSLQGELMALVCQATNDRESAPESAAQPAAVSGWKSVEKILSEHKAARPRAVTKGLARSTSSAEIATPGERAHHRRATSTYQRLPPLVVDCSVLAASN